MLDMNQLVVLLFFLITYYGYLWGWIYFGLWLFIMHCDSNPLLPCCIAVHVCISGRLEGEPHHLYV